MKKFLTITILTDFDEEGNTINKMLTPILEKRGVKVDFFYRKRFCELLEETGIQTIEGVYQLKNVLIPFS